MVTAGVKGLRQHAAALTAEVARLRIVDKLLVSRCTV